MIKRLLIIGIILFSIGLGAQPSDAGIGGARDIYDGSLYPDKAVRTYSQTERIFPTRVITAGGKPSPLLQSNQQLTSLKFTSEGKAYDLPDYVALNRMVGLLVLKDGKIAYEH